ncbi:potassium voltage-gated channel subfamily KQT member 2 isoform X5 [Nasonia vitripennis]|uniref:KCNQ potassium channel n=1 Tax=Nasonia vitripennis TaxID=7425 RepID=A0A7M7Q1W9_NASVI|nr:potassium voltage-gated channel subfamily KQT member 2 isoform X5 [Nasonia vitripennis]
MTSETSSAADSPALLHRPLLTTYSDSAALGAYSSRTGCSAGLDATTTGSPRRTTTATSSTTSPPTARFSPPSVRFHTLDMDQKTLRSGGVGGRLAAPRMSLLGRPVNYRATRRDARYRRLQARVYNFLERPRGVYAVTYHMIVFCMVFMCLVLSVFSTIDEYEKEAGVLLFYMEMVVVVWFTAEFFFRLWSSGCRSRYQTAIGRLKFLRRPFCIIDVITIIASVVVLAMRSSGQVFAASALRGLRFFQILRMVRMDRRGGTWKLLGSVVYAHRQELITTLYIGFLGLIFASFLVYLAEKDDEHFNNFAKALWWGVITLCTVGYGDAVPKTWQGKVIASFCALLGISFFALPAGILGSGFALKVQQQQRQKHMIRRRQPAASLIQALWRCYAADEHSMSVATWKIHQVPLPSPPSSRPSSSFKHNASFVSRLPTIRRPKSTSLHSPSLHKLVHQGYQSQRGNVTRGFADLIASAENLDNEKAARILGGQPNTNGNSNNSNEQTGGGGGGMTTGRQLNASYSEDSVTETALSKRNSDAAKYRIGRSSSTLELRELRIDGLIGRLGETSSTLPLALAGLVSPLPPLPELLGSPTSPNASPTSEKNEDEEPRCVQLTNQHKAAIRAIRKLKYFVARKKFREALKPYDVKDVIEQYSSGHADLLNRVRNLHFRLDQILGKQGSKARDVYASKISLASRIVKVERQVDDIEMKLDQLIELYMEDRKRLLALPTPEPGPAYGSGGGNGAGAAAGVGAGTSGVAPDTPLSAGLGAPGSCGFVLKPILVDKQLSEPSSPTSGNFRETTPDRSHHHHYHHHHPGGKPRQMHRGHSDLGSRVKKRVTLSSIPSHLVLPVDAGKPPRLPSSPTIQSAPPSAMTTRQGDVVIMVPPLAGAGSDSEANPEPEDSRTTQAYSSASSTTAVTSVAGQVELPSSAQTADESSGGYRLDEHEGVYSPVDSEEDDEEDEEEEEDEDEEEETDERGEPDYEEEEEETSCENTALLGSGSVRTQIIVTPSMSPVQSSQDLALVVEHHHQSDSRS